MQLSLRKKVLMSMGVIAGVGALAGAGTFASFSAQTTNQGNTFATGTLVLSDTVTGGSACLSTGGGNTDSNANGSCPVAFNLSVKKPGDSGTATLTLENKGSVAASALKVFSPSCTNSDAATESYHGTGNPCTKVQLYVQQYSDAAFAVPSACLYGGSTGGLGVTCDFSDTTKTLSAFATAYPNASGGLSTGALTAAGGATPAAYFKVGVMLPSSADNTFQGRSASMDLSWYISQ